MVSDIYGTGGVFIIAEAGVNHDGSLEKALNLVDIAADAGADAVKFQTFRADEVVTRDAGKAAYQEKQTGEGSQYEMIRALELDDAAHVQIAERCVERGIEFMSTAFAPWSIDFLVGLGMKRLKVASGEIVNKPLLQRIAERRLPVILSTGMANMDEVVRAVAWIRGAWKTVGHSEKEGDLVVLHCTSDYPAAPSDVNLRAMDSLHDTLGVPVGYSDHSIGAEVSVAAVARGACVIEKHFTIDRTAFGPDHAASLSPEQLSTMVQAIRNIELALGDGEKKPSSSEIPTRDLVRRSAFAAREFKAGEKIGEEGVVFLRPGDGIGPQHADRLFVSHAAHAIAAGKKIMEDDLS